MNVHVRAVIKKELREYRRNRMIVFTMAVLPLIFLAVPLFTALAIPEDATPELVDRLMGQTGFFLLLIALVVPSTIAAYTVIGERDQGTLEPVLTTPATDSELLLGKAIAATAPAVVLAWSLYLAFLVIVRFGATSEVVARIWRADQVVGEIVLVPTLAVLTILIGMMISARVSDMRVAQQLSGLVIIPMGVGYFLLAIGIVETSVTLFIGLALVLAMADAVLWRVVVRLFDRERLLTQFGGGSGGG